MQDLSFFKNSAVIYNYYFYFKYFKLKIHTLHILVIYSIIHNMTDMVVYHLSVLCTLICKTLISQTCEQPYT